MDTEKHKHDDGCGCGCCHDYKNGQHSHSEHDNENSLHHHAHGHDSACACAACQAAENIFDENEEDERRQKAEFKKEITFLGITGIIFVILMIIEEAELDIIPDNWLNVGFIVLYILIGHEILKTAISAIFHGDIFNEFTLMSGATLAAIATGEMSESVGVMIFYRLGEAIQERAASKSRRSIRALMAQKPVVARLVRDGETIEKDPKDIAVGDIVKVLPGEIVPIDGHIIEGKSSIDTSTITGESVPEMLTVGDEVHGGTLAINGMLLIKAAGPYEDSTIAKVLEMVQNAVERKAPTERFITRFAKIYTPTVFFIAAAVMLIPTLFMGGEWKEWLYRGLVILVISCPCALMISVPLGYFGGIGAASKNGILVKGANVIDAVGKVTCAVFDKTGTLTYGKFKVTKILPADGISEHDLIQTAAAAEYGSSHPLSSAIMKIADISALPKGVEIEQLSGKGMLCRTADNMTILSGNTSLMNEFNVNVPQLDNYGTTAHVARNGKYIGTIIASDEVRDDSEAAVKALRTCGIDNVYMLTGDRNETARNVAELLHLDGFRAELLPGDKVTALKELCGGRTDKTIYVGDGVNDGPVLVTSQTGIAMGGFGSQVAVELADAVILDDSPMKVADLLRIAKKTRTIVWENVGIALGIKLIFLFFGAAGLAGLWEAVFADVGVCLLAILNSTRTARIK